MVRGLKTQTCHTNMPHKRASQTFLTNVPHKHASQTCLTNMPHKHASQTCLTNIAHKHASQTLPTNMPHKRKPFPHQMNVIPKCTFFVIFYVVFFYDSLRIDDFDGCSLFEINCTSLSYSPLYFNIIRFRLQVQHHTSNTCTLATI